MKNKNKEIISILKNIAKKYPKDLIKEQLIDVPRILFHINMILSLKGKNAKICDIGGGIGLFSIGCAALGMDVLLVDDFKDDVNKKFGFSILDVHKSYGVNVMSSDVLNKKFKLSFNKFDAITSFDVMEHFHHSPKHLFYIIKKALKPGGLFY